VTRIGGANICDLREIRSH